MTPRRIFFWILLIFTLFVVYESVLNPLLERLLWDRDTPFVASKKSINPQGLALPLLIYFTWRIFKWSDPERLEEERIEQEIEERIEKQRVQKETIEKQRIDRERIGKKGYNKLMYLSAYGEINEIKNQFSLSSVDINAQDKGGYTALMYAASGGHFKVVELLLSFGADKGLVTKKGNNALFFAKNNSHTEIISILHANPPVTDKNNTPQGSTNYSGESNQPSSMSTEEKIADFESRLNYKAEGLTEAQQEKLDTEFHNYARSRRLPD